jgi:hypothetical protein
MVHRLLDVLMQDAWSLTAFVIRRRAKAESALHSLSVVLCVYQIQPSTASMKIMPVDESNKSTLLQSRNEGALVPKSPPIGTFMSVQRIADSRHTASAATIASNPEKISE